MKKTSSLATILLSTLAAAPVSAGAGWVSVAAAPTASPLALAALGAVLGAAGIRLLRNRRGR